MIVFEWDGNKEKLNISKHDVDITEAESVFNDPFSITVADPDHSIEEDRFIDIGMSDKNRVLVIVYTERDENIRIISVGKAKPTERKIYEQQ